MESKRQRIVIIREMLIAFLIMVLFTFIGEELMHFLHITQSSVQIAGGIVLFIICLKMIFPPSTENTDVPQLDEDPFVVPLAVPLVAGPAVLAAVMIYAKQETNIWVVIGGIFIAWLASLIVLLLSPYLQKLLGKRGLTAMERLMGLILTMIAVQMFLSGIERFMHNSFNV